ncbi:hypothetical protein Tco_0871646 [Tanacetum coccineum]
MGLPEFLDNTVTDYSRPTPSIDVLKDVSDEQKAIWKLYGKGIPHDNIDVGRLSYATSLDAGQDRENIANTSTMPHEASPGVTSLGGGEGSMQQKLQELMDMCTKGKQQHFLMELKDSESFPTAAPTGVATASGSFPTTVIFTTASVTTPYTRRKRSSRGIIIEPSHTTSVLTISAKGKGKEKMVESIGTKKKKIQEQLDAQVAKELEMEFAREEQLIKEQGEKDAEIARAQAEKELGMMIAETSKINPSHPENVCSPSSQILALDFLAFNLGPMGLEGIAKVEIVVYKVGFEESDGE